MNKKQKAKRDIEMAFDFARYLIDHPDEIAKIPDGSEVSFYEKSGAKPLKHAERRKRIQVNVKRDFEIKKKVA
jgi:hypothetical protein